MALSREQKSDERTYGCECDTRAQCTPAHPPAPPVCASMPMAVLPSSVRCVNTCLQLGALFGGQFTRLWQLQSYLMNVVV
jgi:hypothetical protein